ncbi:glycoside hydrolase family 18 protein [Ascoidea rubescens DSM 1968]|uniref:chitinase n=1 Tax=Ascoidea rubescens DSM 1968 TaxID=1344418 RepID=A0A1D2VNK3_9ASCO|nr:glycoside hydrolase family 18 protein [Ascoidea rubescens DSM 1968]ODV63188.1 glycoside hydrolase family 18 protein [Ascoidea rubescens DSM 1968]
MQIPFILFITFLLQFSTTLGKFSKKSNKNIAAYWGQNTMGTQTNFTAEEERLSFYCQSDSVDIILLAFMNMFPGNNSIPRLVFSAGEFSYTYQETINQLETDIKTCQKNEKLVLLSLGGQSADYGFSSVAEAVNFASILWDMFGEDYDDDQLRPFGSAVVDGFDFDIENSNDVGYVELIEELREIIDENGSKDYYISAAPQCPYPADDVVEILNNSYVDFLFIQFYNNEYNCDANTDRFNWNTWASYAKDISKNENVKIYLGLPGSNESAVSGFIDNSTLLENRINQAKKNSSFGGVMVWDASTSFNTTIDDELYIDMIKYLLTGDDKYFEEQSSSYICTETDRCFNQYNHVTSTSEDNGMKQISILYGISPILSGIITFIMFLY